MYILYLTLCRLFECQLVGCAGGDSLWREPASSDVLPQNSTEQEEVERKRVKDITSETKAASCTCSEVYTYSSQKCSHAVFQCVLSIEGDMN